MISRIALALLIAVPLGLSAQTEQQDAAAQRITALSDSFRNDVADNIFQPMRKNILLLEGCDLTIVRLVEEMSFSDPPQPSTYAGVHIRVDLTLANLQRKDDGTAWDFLESDIFGSPIGELLFTSDIEVDVNIHKNIESDTAVNDILNTRIDESYATRIASFAYVGNITPAHMARLADALISYKRDYCTLAS